LVYFFFAFTILLRLLNCITETIQVAEGRMLASPDVNNTYNLRRQFLFPFDQMPYHSLFDNAYNKKR